MPELQSATMWLPPDLCAVVAPGLTVKMLFTSFINRIGGHE